MTTLQIDGPLRAVTTPPDTPLRWALRDELGMPDTKFGCGIRSPMEGAAIVGLALALANAIFAATGKRYLGLPRCAHIQPI